ncbi:MAG: methyltransferase domain-containing protein [Leptospiraceae bacterium]|nr:methyltransferase domain-containing protein [Leptospiraceae bacterium]MCP5511006.1 methyltransferase domain-containing protein [Leptospiraceae bacterium]
MQELKETINVRYAGEASCCSNLSCGGALDYAGPKSGEVFIDLGSGRGNDVLRASRSVGKEGQAIGVDFTKEMVEVAEINRKKLMIENVKFVESQIEALPFANDFADVIISNCTINHSPDKSKVYSEVYRVLKPGGRAVISDVLSEGKLPDEVVNDPEAWAGCYGGAIPKEEYYEAISKGGFTDVEVLEESSPYEKGGVMVKSITIRLSKL